MAQIKTTYLFRQQNENFLSNGSPFSKLNKNLVRKLYYRKSNIILIGTVQLSVKGCPLTFIQKKPTDLILTNFGNIVSI